MKSIQTILPLFLLSVCSWSVSACGPEDLPAPKTEEPTPSTDPSKVDDVPVQPDEPTQTVTDGVVVKRVMVDAQSYAVFNYFSFEQERTVFISDQQSPQSASWDLAFHRRDIRTNGGLSSEIGSQGAVYETNLKNITDPIAFPGEDKMVADTLMPVSISHTDMTGVYQVMLPVSPVLTSQYRMQRDKDGNPIMKNGFEQYDILHYGAFAVDLGQMPPPLTISNKIYLVRTAKGKYAKVQFVDYYKKLPNGNLLRAMPSFLYVYPVEFTK